MMKRYIDAHVHITPAAALGTKNDRFGTEVMPYGYLKMGEEGFTLCRPIFMTASSRKTRW